MHTQQKSDYNVLDNIHKLTMRRILKILNHPRHDLRYSIYMDCDQDTVRFKQRVWDSSGHEIPLGHDDLLFDAIMQLWEHFLYKAGFEFSEAHYHFNRQAAGNWLYNFQIIPRTDPVDEAFLEDLAC